MTPSPGVSISVVTPSFNQVDFVRQAMESVRDQDHDAVEHIVMDGGSTDGTLDVLADFRADASITSGPDGGQTDAINQGLRRSRGDVVCWLNTDDYFLPGTLSSVARHFAADPDLVWLTADCQIVDAVGREIQKPVRLYKRVLRSLPEAAHLGLTNAICQPATFWRRSAHERIGYLDEDLDYTMDYDWWLRLRSLGRPLRSRETLTAFRIHEASKGGSAYREQFREDLETFRRHSWSPTLTRAHAAHNALITRAYDRVK